MWHSIEHRSTGVPKRSESESARTSSHEDQYPSNSTRTCLPSMDANDIKLYIYSIQYNITASVALEAAQPLTISRFLGRCVHLGYHFQKSILITPGSLKLEIYISRGCELLRLCCRLSVFSSRSWVDDTCLICLTGPSGVTSPAINSALPVPKSICSNREPACHVESLKTPVGTRMITSYLFLK